jgi:hypothetical protein
MELTAIVIGLALIEYTVFTMLCGRARGRFGVVAPATSGDPTFERYFRVQQNSVEQLIIFVPAMRASGSSSFSAERCSPAVTTEMPQNGPPVSACPCSRTWCCCSGD